MSNEKQNERVGVLHFQEGRKTLAMTPASIALKGRKTPTMTPIPPKQPSNNAQPASATPPQPLKKQKS